MTDLGGLNFWVAVITIAVLSRRVPLIARFALYLGALYLVVEAKMSMLLLASVITYGWVALRIGTGALAIALHTFAISAFFAASQHGPVLLPEGNLVARALPLVGLPYVFLRFVHVLVEVRTGRLERPGFVHYVVYMLPFHQMIAGPIQRYDEYAKVIAEPTPLDHQTFVEALNRITNGFIKKVVLAQLLMRVVGFRFESTGWELWFEVDLYAIYMYLDFSGYMDIIIGAGMLMGWKPPENFDWPYLSRNLIEFWKRWHITLGDWLRDYVFLPLNLALMRSRFGNSPFLTGVVCYFVTMLVCGLWHRFDAQFALWGALHGTGIVICKLYEMGLKKLVSRKQFKTYRQSRLSAVFAGFTNFQYIAVSFLFAFNPPAEAIEIVRRLAG